MPYPPAFPSHWTAGDVCVDLTRGQQPHADGRLDVVNPVNAGSFEGDSGDHGVRAA
jgi:hypothetical protein